MVLHAKYFVPYAPPPPHAVEPGHLATVFLFPVADNDLLRFANGSNLLPIS